VTRQAEILSLARAAKVNFDVQLVVTSREHVTGPHLRDLLRIRISEFEDEQIEEFLGKWFGDNQAELSEFKTQLSKVPSLHEVMRVPLLATLVLGVYRNTKALPESRVSLYEMFLRLLAGGWDIAKRVNRETQFGPTPKLTVLIRLASLLHVGRRRDANEGDLKSAINQTLPGLLDSRHSLLDELVQDGFLVPAGLTTRLRTCRSRSSSRRKISSSRESRKRLTLLTSISAAMIGGERSPFSMWRYLGNQSSWKTSYAKSQGSVSRARAILRSHEECTSFWSR
jgi:hypothetical protein